MRWWPAWLAAWLGPAVLAPVAAPLSTQQAPLAAIDRYVRDEIRRERVPGVSVAIVRGGRVVLARGYGEANVELMLRPPTAPCTSPARWASNSRPPSS